MDMNGIDTLDIAWLINIDGEIYYYYKWDWYFGYCMIN